MRESPTSGPVRRPYVLNKLPPALDQVSGGCTEVRWLDTVSDSNSG
jgi:hypothetical protein